MLLKQIIDMIESVAPLSGQMEWDNSGLQIGHMDADITSVLCCTDVTEAVMDEAIQMGCGLVLSHHPLLFHGLKTIAGATYQERVVEKAILHGVAVYSAHTSLDVVLRGVSARMADKLGVENYRILSPTGSPEVGLGVVGMLPKPLPVADFLQRVKDTFHVGAIRYTAPARTTIRTVALAGGACGDLWEEALRSGADAYISAEFHHHELLAAAAGQMMVLDIGHFESEQFTKEIFRDILAPVGLTVSMAQADVSPILTI